jgi:hypothetical protein
MSPLSLGGIPLPVLRARKPILFYVRVGVTGHRDLGPDLKVTVRGVEEALDLIISLFPTDAQKNCRLVAVAALADGADRVVADHILARADGSLEVILPLPERDYISDFSNSSRAEFARLLARASRVTVVPREQTREAAYYSCGRAVVDRADVTIAIWDGRPPRGRGSTAEVVQYVLQTKRPLIWIPADGAGLVATNMERLATSIRPLRRGKTLFIYG